MGDEGKRICKNKRYRLLIFDKTYDDERIMTFNRGLYSQGANMQSINEAQKDAEKHDKKFYDDSGRVGYHEIKEGRNLFRIAVAHEAKDSPYLPIRFSNMEVEVDEYDTENNKTGNKIWKRRKNYISTQHGPRNQYGVSQLTTDPIEFYIEFLTNKLKREILNEKDREKALLPIHGYWSEGKYQWGIRPETKTICYAWNEAGELKQLELNKRWYSEMQGIIIGASGSSNVAVDIFSHVDNGSPLVIEKTVTKEQGKRNKTEYKITKEDPDMMKRESWDTFFERTRVTDQQLQDLLEKKSLKEMYSENYTRADFGRAIQGLRRFDEIWKFGLFSLPEFMEKLKEIEKEVFKNISEPNEDQQETAEAKSVPDQGQDQETLSANPDSVVGEGPGNPPESKKMTVPKMRKFLREYVADNYTEDEYQLPVLKGEELKRWYELAVIGEDLPWETLGGKIADDAQVPDDLPWGEDGVDKAIDDIKNAEQ